MNVLVILIPISLILGGAGLAAFYWTLRARQYDDPAGDARRILTGKHDQAPAQD